MLSRKRLDVSEGCLFENVFTLVQQESSKKCILKRKRENGIF